MKSLDLFDFYFTEENEDMYTVEKVNEQFALLQDISKENKNAYAIDLNDLPRNVVMYLDVFEKTAGLNGEEVVPLIYWIII